MAFSISNEGGILCESTPIRTVPPLCKDNWTSRDIEETQVRVFFPHPQYAITTLTLDKTDSTTS
jgi:hypothetical protein